MTKDVGLLDGYADVWGSLTKQWDEEMIAKAKPLFKQAMSNAGFDEEDIAQTIV